MGKREERWDEEERCVGKAKSCLRFEGVATSGSGNSGAVTWSEMTDSEATACARFTVGMNIVYGRAAILYEQQTIDRPVLEIEMPPVHLQSPIHPRSDPKISVLGPQTVWAVWSGPK